MVEIHSLLRRQVLRTFGGTEAIPDDLKSFLEGVNTAYLQFDLDRAMLERSLDLSSTELLQANADLRAVFEVLPDLFFRLDKDGTILDCKAGAITGFISPQKSMIGRLIQAIPIPEVAKKFAEALEEVNRTKTMVSIEYALGTDDHRTYYEARVLPMLNSQLITVVRDITDQKQAEIALREGEERLRLIFDTAFDAIIGTDSNADIIVWNPQAEKTFGWSHDEAMGCNFIATIVPARDQRIFTRALDIFLKRGHSSILGRRVEITAVHRDGHELPMELAVSPIRINQAVFFSAFLRDLSARKQLLEERDMMEVQLRHAQKLEAIGHLAAGIAHEINTPTQYIGDNMRFVSDSFQDIERLIKAEERLLIAAMKENFATEVVADIQTTVKSTDIEFLRSEIPKAIDQALEGVERVTTIVRAMKDFSHPGSSVKVLVDLNHAIESTITVSRNEWKYVADLTAELEPGLPPVLCQPSEFNQVILNIIVNASHAISDATENGAKGKGKISIQTLSRGDWVEVRVSDTGIGIPERARDKVFDPFFTTKGVGKGTGQGLAIAHSIIVDKHGGTIFFESEIGKGTTFVIRLPVREAESIPMLLEALPKQ